MAISPAKEVWIQLWSSVMQIKILGYSDRCPKEDWKQNANNSNDSETIVIKLSFERYLRLCEIDEVSIWFAVTVNTQNKDTFLFSILKNSYTHLSKLKNPVLSLNTSFPAGYNYNRSRYWLYASATRPVPNTISEDWWSLNGCKWISHSNDHIWIKPGLEDMIGKVTGGTPRLLSIWKQIPEQFTNSRYFESTNRSSLSFSVFKKWNT